MFFHRQMSSLLCYLMTGVVSLSPNEAGIIPLKASYHSLSPSPSSTSTDSLRFSDVPFGPTTVSINWAPKSYCWNIYHGIYIHSVTKYGIIYCVDTLSSCTSAVSKSTYDT